ncbi:MAG: hypothetical protein NVSMB55_03230 [Mycobacteriales bacterium]
MRTRAVGLALAALLPLLTALSGPAQAATTPTFSPTARTSGAAPSRLVTVADVSTSAGRVITVSMSVAKPSSVYLKRSASTAAGFPLSSVRACLAQIGSRRCTPRTVPNPAFWPVSAADLRRTHRYQLVVVVTTPTAALLELRAGWTGPGRVSVAGLRLPGGCTGATGYRAGCGVKSHLTLRTGGGVTLSSATAGLKANVKDKTTGQKLASQILRGSLTTSLPAGHEWSLHLFPHDGGPVSSMSLSISWP